MKANIKKALVTVAVMLAMVLTLTGCKTEKPVETKAPLSDSEAKKITLSCGQSFFTAFIKRDTTEMAKLTQEEKRASFIEAAEKYYKENQSTPWIEEYYQTFVKDTQVVESDYSRNGDNTTVTYKVIIANYDSKQVGSLISYDVKLNFIIVDSTYVYVLNPDISLELYDSMVDDYARYLVTVNYKPKTAEEPAETNQTVNATDPVTKETVTSPDENDTTETTTAPTATTAAAKKKKK